MQAKHLLILLVACILETAHTVLIATSKTWIHAVLIKIINQK